MNNEEDEAMSARKFKELVFVAAICCGLLVPECGVARGQMKDDAAWLGETTHQIRWTVQNAESARRGLRQDAELSKAAVDFLAAQTTPAFNNCRILRRFRAEFLSYPELAEINRRYWEKGAAMTFVSDTARSPIFRELLGNYIQKPEFLSALQTHFSTPALLRSRDHFIGLYRL